MPPKKRNAPGRKSKLSATDDSEVSANSAVSRCISLPEVVAAVLESLNTPDCAKALPACRLWHTVGSDVLWRDLDDIFPLLRLITALSPLEQEIHGGLWRYSEDLSAVDWERYHFYANRVRSIFFDADVKKQGKRSYLSCSLMRSIAFYHPCNQPLVPNLRKIVWKGNSDSTAKFVIPLLSSNLDEVELSFAHGVTAPTLCHIFGALSSRSRNVKIFSLETPLQPHAIALPLAQWITTCTTLREVTLPELHQSAEVVKALGGLQGLRRLDRNTWSGPGPTESAGGMEFAFSGDSFPALEELSLNASILRAIEVLEGARQAAQLQAFHLGCYTMSLRNNVQDLCSILWLSCPLLRSVHISLFPDAALSASLYHEGPMTLKSIEPLLGCPLIDTFKITHGYPIVVAEEDVLILSKAWPKLQWLYLDSEPHLDILHLAATSGNNVNILYHLAKHLPGLRELELFFDERLDLDIPDDFDPSVQFQRLTSLEAGISRVPQGDVIEFGAFIANLCARDVEILYRDSIWSREDEEEEDRVSADWEEVERTVRVVQKAKRLVERRVSSVARGS